MRESGGNCLKYLKREWNRKEEKGNKDFKKRGQAGSRGGCALKRGGGSCNPLTNYGLSSPDIMRCSFNMEHEDEGFMNY